MYIATCQFTNKETVLYRVNPSFMEALYSIIGDKGVTTDAGNVLITSIFIDKISERARRGMATRVSHTCERPLLLLPRGLPLGAR